MTAYPDTEALRKAEIWAKTLSSYEVEHNVLKRVLRSAKQLSIPPYPTRKKQTPVQYTPEFVALYNVINNSPDIARYREKALPRWYEVYLAEGYERFSNAAKAPSQV